MIYQLTQEGDMPISVSALRDHCRVYGSDWDTQLTRAFYAAAYDVERRSGVLLRPCTVTTQVRGGSAMRGLVLPVGPAVLGSETITDGTDALTEGFYLDVNCSEPTLRVTDPTQFDSETMYTVSYDAGYTQVPGDLTVAVLELTAHHFENREATTDKPLYAVPSSVWSIVANYGRGKV